MGAFWRQKETEIRKKSRIRQVGRPICRAANAIGKLKPGAGFDPVCSMGFAACRQIVRIPEVAKISSVVKDKAVILNWALIG
ncbi:hypothetical protein [Pseudophaeobacter sp.]|uniref:hypothetical protein n=1 Tax=Pseudophaeobacter sp. TaxID=1971739 RepID=UPI003299E5D8